MKYSEKEEIILSEFTKNQIKALILYYIFYLKLNENIINSNENIIDSECYLISEKWMNKYKIHFLYEKLIEIIKKIFKKESFNLYDKEIDKKIYEKLLNDEYNDYLKNIKKNENNYPNYFEDIKKIEYIFVDFDFNAHGIIKIPSKFEILNIEVYEKIYKRKNYEFNLIKKKYLIINGKIIIKFDKLLKILIGTYDFTNNIFIPEILFDYTLRKLKNKIDEHFLYLKLNRLKEFMKNKISKNKKHLIANTSDENKPCNIVGNIFYLNNNENENKKKNNSLENKQDNEKMYYFEFFFRLYFFNENLNIKMHKLLIIMI